MGITSRKKIPVTSRKSSFLKDASLIIIASEGHKTEKQYFDSDCFCSSRLKIIVLESLDNKSAPVHVLNRMKDYIKKELVNERIDIQSGDQLWLVIDKDKWTNKMLSDVCSTAIKMKKFPLKVALSNPSFELWLYLHHDEWRDGEIDGLQLEKLLKKKIGGYSKNKVNMEVFCSKVDDAISRAEIMDKSSNSRWPSNPGTHVYKLAKVIKNLLK